MPAAITTPTPANEIVDGVKYSHYVIVEDETTVQGEEWSLPVPTNGTISLIEADLIGAGAATTIQTAVGAEPTSGWVVGGVGHIHQVGAAGLNLRDQSDQRYRARDGAAANKLYFRSLPNANLGAGQSIVTRVTIKWGHK